MLRSQRRLGKGHAADKLFMRKAGPNSVRLCVAVLKARRGLHEFFLRVGVMADRRPKNFHRGVK